MFRKYKWFRKLHKGNWYKVKEYETHTFIWVHDVEISVFPEFDGLFMENIGSCVYKGKYTSFYGWSEMTSKPTESYT